MANTSFGLVAEDRALLRVEGEERLDWLQGLVSNDVSHLTPDRPVYAALLTPQGKYLFDFFLVQQDEQAILIDVDASRVTALSQRLSLYKVRRKVTLASASELGVALIWGAKPNLPTGLRAIADPRDEKLGWRLYADDPSAALAAAGVTAANPSDYDRLRVMSAAPATGVELVPDETFILEAGFDRLNGVDFRKGCYVGQEVTARMRHKTELKKGLRRVAVEGTPPQPGAELTAADGKPAGTLFTVVEGTGLAHVRFDRASKPMKAGEARVQLLNEQ